MKRIIAMCSLLVVAITLSGCFTPSGLDSKEQKNYAKDMADASLKDLYKYQPEAQAVIEGASGYIVYNTYAIDYFFLATENGWGVAFNKKTGASTYLKDLTIGLGPGLGVCVMRNILVFDNETDFNMFIAGGWSLNVKADAVARFSEAGKGHVAAGANITNGARVYLIGNKGLIAEAIFDVSKSWVNSSLE